MGTLSRSPSVVIGRFWRGNISWGGSSLACVWFVVQHGASLLRLILRVASSLSFHCGILWLVVLDWLLSVSNRLLLDWLSVSNSLLLDWLLNVLNALLHLWSFWWEWIVSVKRNLFIFISFVINFFAGAITSIIDFELYVDDLVPSVCILSCSFFNNFVRYPDSGSAIIFSGGSVCSWSEFSLCDFFLWFIFQVFVHLRQVGFQNLDIVGWETDLFSTGWINCWKGILWFFTVRSWIAILIFLLIFWHCNVFLLFYFIF